MHWAAYLEGDTMPAKIDDPTHPSCEPLAGKLCQQDIQQGLHVVGQQVLGDGPCARKQPHAGFHGVWPHDQVAHLVDEHSVAAPLVQHLCSIALRAKPVSLLLLHDVGWQA